MHSIVVCTEQLVCLNECQTVNKLSLSALYTRSQMARCTGVCRAEWVRSPWGFQEGEDREAMQWSSELGNMTFSSRVYTSTFKRACKRAQYKRA